ncbi:MAG: DUF58 domain-containing protein [Rubricoccaceae bacterium]|nr:DUF58 domain-containing protein [Rubricoccaceae bacterium]
MALLATIKAIYLSRRFFAVFAGIIALCVSGYYWNPLFIAALVCLLLLGALVLADILLLRLRGRGKAGGLHAERIVPPQLSNGDLNVISIHVENCYPFKVSVRVIDEVPIQFQVRDQGFEIELKKGERQILRYTLRPTERGSYAFGSVNLFAKSPIGLVLRRFKSGAEAEAAVYPSIIQMHRYAFLAASNRLEEIGIKKVRRVGHTMEFDQIRDYVTGDDRRTINWNATARRGGDLMVNQYEDERSQPVYAMLDMGRAMRSPFDGMTLLDHSINAALVLLNIALQKSDKAGLVAFNEEIQAVLPADRRRAQLSRILDALYRVTTSYMDPSYEALLATTERSLRKRGLVLLFTNFETRNGLRRQLPYLRRIAKLHRLVVVFFENTGLEDLLTRRSERLEDVYVKAFGEGLDVEKREIARELERHGVGALLTRPERLTVDAINKYLQLKARGAF